MTHTQYRKLAQSTQEINLDSDHTESVCSDDDQEDRETVAQLPDSFRLSTTENHADGVFLYVQSPHKSIYTTGPVTNSVLRRKFADPSSFSSLEREDGVVVKIEKK